MTSSKCAANLHVEYHKDGSVWARGNKVGELPEGYWEWFRKDGTRLRSGHFEQGRQVGTWTTYDKNGDVYKVTELSASGKKQTRIAQSPKSADNPRATKRSASS